MDRRLLLVGLAFGTVLLGTGCGLNTEGTGAYAEPEFDSGFDTSVTSHPDASKADADSGRPDTSVPDTSIDTRPDQTVVDTGPDGPPDALLEDVESGITCWTGQKMCGSCIPDNNPQTGCAEKQCTACTFAHAQATCSSGQCAILQCDDGWANCDGDSKNGCETNTDGDVNNCGKCGQGCSPPNADGKCVSGACQIAKCHDKYGDCDATQPGCETPLTTVDNCEACGKKCQVTGGTPTCATGTCGLAHCNAPLEDCNHDNVCETNLSTDVNNCGFCGNVCSRTNASAKCDNGVCKIDTCNAGFGDCNTTDSDGCEVNLQSSVDNCGSCGGKCDPTNGTAPTCGKGKCSYTCNPGWGDCNGPLAGNADDGCEVNTDTTATSCGACNRVCSGTHAQSGGLTCAAGKCTSACAAGWGNCTQPSAPNADDGCEVDITTAVNCGACGRACSATNASAAHCNTSTLTCDSPCKSGYSNCKQPAAPATDDGCEVASATDATNCGGCGRVCAANGVATPSCSGGLCNSSCISGLGNCKQPTYPTADDGCETDLVTSADNCGACNAACSSSHVSTRACSAGTCTPTCASGYTNCDGQKPPATDNGCETNTGKDILNCGTCNNVCTSTGGTPWCSANVCGISCSTGYADCDGKESNGCEISLTNDANNCNGCGNVCSTVNGGATCKSSACQIACYPNYGDCNASPGCETSLLNDKNNCGACNKVCNSTGGTASCSNGVCKIACSAGYADCNNDPTDGCETALNTTTNCGSCGNKCSTTGGSAQCNSGTCGIACSAGFGDCNNNASDGCETPITTTTNCGSCGNACSLPNATAACASGTCKIASCNPGYGDCDNNPTNGCETPTNTTSNCGACAKACTAANGTPSCNGGTCGIASCSAGYDNCDNNVANGCETDLSSTSSCGVCGRACSTAHVPAATPISCLSGGCFPTACDVGWTNLSANLNPDDGCETAISPPANDAGEEAGDDAATD